MTKIFLDTEFIEYPNTIQLISIGMVSEDNREYYAISNEYNYKKASKWVKDNVILPMYQQEVGDIQNNLTLSNFHKYIGKSINTIRYEILDFLDYPYYRKGTPEFWSYFADFDWVIFSWIFGTMMSLPQGFPKYCKDIQQLMDQYGLDDFPSIVGKHNALVDAKWHKDMYNYVMRNINKY